MAGLKNACILLIVIFMGWFYYKLSVSKITAARNYAFYMKMMLLIISFILAFAGQDFIVIGTLAFGGRTPVMLLIIIEIVDAFIDKRKSK